MSDTVGRFDDRVADYVRYRPSYPREAVDAVFPRLESLFVVDEGTSGPPPLLNLDPNARRAGGGR